MNPTLRVVIEATDPAGWELPITVHPSTFPPTAGEYDLVESDLHRTRVAIVGPHPDAVMISTVLNHVLSLYEKRTTCAYDDCPYEVVDTVEITLPSFIGPFRLLHEIEREREVSVCAEHAEMLRAYFVVEHLGLRFTLAEAEGI